MSCKEPASPCSLSHENTQRLTTLRAYFAGEGGEGRGVGGSEEASRDAVKSKPEVAVGEQRFLTGVVTSISSDDGMVNDSIYFDVGVVMGGVKVEVGDVVHVEAVRQHRRAGWCANRYANTVLPWLLSMPSVLLVC